MKTPTRVVGKGAKYGEPHRDEISEIFRTNYLI